jgi:guanosine-3',5'-bis(diphosphate) 3'-pyrophosphohydrolase
MAASTTSTSHPWQAAAALAAFKHRHQLRKDGRTPYISHPVRVAMTCATVFGVRDDITIAAALLHDLIEDTTTDYDDLLEKFGEEIADIVACLTKDARMIESERERAYDRQLAEGPWRARIIKLADVYDNLHDIVDHSAAGARPSHEGQDAVAEVLERARRAMRLVANDAQAADALDAVRQLVQRVERSLGTTMPPLSRGDGAQPVASEGPPTREGPDIASREQPPVFRVMNQGQST